MKHLRLSFVFFSLLASVSGLAQFGFQRIDTIDVYKSAVIQKYAWVGGLDFAQFSNIDLDFDGVQDLFVFDREDHKVLTFLQTGTTGAPNWTYAPQYESKFPEYNNIYDAFQDEHFLFNWVLLVDYNCDGKKDIFASRSGGIKVFRNTGNATDGLSFVQTSLRIKSLQWGIQQYLYVSSADLPGIKDIDGDGDVDIITFGGTGQALEYHRNMSMETYGHCDSLIFEMKNTCWGRFRESATTNAVTLWDTLVYPCDDMSNVLNPESWRPYGEMDQDRHSGSTVLPIDLNGNGIMDLILGDISYSHLTMLMNSGTAPNTNSGMSSSDITFPSNSVAVDVDIYPGAYYTDVDNDGKRDLLVSPSSTVGSENRVSTWYYRNTGTDNSPVFEYQQPDFIQGDMIDVGTRALPVFFDHNGDGLKDLLVSSQGHYDPLSGNQISSIYYYQNTGTAAHPEFTWVTDDYMNLSQMGVGYSLFFYPTFGDLDNDGDEDMILGEYSGYCYYFENTGGAGNPAVFGTYDTLDDYLGNHLITPTNTGIYPCPTLVDLDRDGDLDLVVGRRNGKLDYCENIGSASASSFLFLTDHLGGVNVCEWWSTEGHAVPAFVDVNGEYKLIIGSRNGYLHLYDDIESNIATFFHLVDSSLDNINEGIYAAPTIADLNGDDRFEMVLGNARGGVLLYKSANSSNIGLIEQELQAEVIIYPNPGNETVFVVVKSSSAKQELVTVDVSDLSGRVIYSGSFNGSQGQINTSEWDKGTYVFSIRTSSETFVRKVIIL